MSTRVAILGATGSIGCNALAVMEHLGPGFEVVALSANRSVDKLVEQVKRHRPRVVVVAEACLAEARAKLAGTGTEISCGPGGLVDVVKRNDVDVVLSAIVGAAGLPVALATVEAGKTLALANKESLVIAGALLIPLAKKTGATILPVDSEHSAIFQALQCGRREEIKRVLLTASGGPFRTWSAERMKSATVQDALAHPTWNMGAKVTIDSATMFNKALEFIEAAWLFDLRPDQIQIVVHPESIVHSMVEFVDGSVVAQLSPPDMKTPIQYALTYPERRAGCNRTMDWTAAFGLHFEPPDVARFPSLALAYDVAARGGVLGTVLNAANEVAVEAFVADTIGLADIFDIVERTIARAPLQKSPSLADLLEADAWARRTAKEIAVQA